jgi:hypothetical protein
MSGECPKKIGRGYGRNLDTSLLIKLFRSRSLHVPSTSASLSLAAVSPGESRGLQNSEPTHRLTRKSGLDVEFTGAWDAKLLTGGRFRALRALWNGQLACLHIIGLPPSADPHAVPFGIPRRRPWRPGVAVADYEGLTGLVAV